MICRIAWAVSLALKKVGFQMRISFFFRMGGFHTILLFVFVDFVAKRRISTLHSPAGPLVTVEPSKTLTLLWGATGEQEWTPALTTGLIFFLLFISRFWCFQKKFGKFLFFEYRNYLEMNYLCLEESSSVEILHCLRNRMWWISKTATYKWPKGDGKRSRYILSFTIIFIKWQFTWK